MKGHFGKITALHWAGDSRSVVSASQDGNLLLWNAVTANKLQSISLKSSYVMSVGLEQSSRNNLVACGGLDNLCSIYKWNQPNAPAVEMASHDGFVSGCRFISESHILTSSGDSTCLRWDVSRGRVLDTFSEHTADAMALSLRPHDPNVFASASVDQTVKVWDIRTPDKSAYTFSGHTSDVNDVAFMPHNDSHTLASCSEDGTVRVWDMRCYSTVAKFGSPVDTSALDQSGSWTSIGFSGSGRLLFAGHAEASVSVMDVISGKSVAQWNQAHEGHISCLGVSPNGDALCTGSWDYTLKIWA